MPGPRAAALVGSALRCYSRPWRSRHGAEAAELAALLMRDGVPPRSIAWSYLKGAARERLTPGPGHRFAAAAVALLTMAGSLGVALALLSASVPASAASSVRARSTGRDAPAAQLARQLRCGRLPGATVKEAVRALAARHVTITWEVSGGWPAGAAVPGSYYVTSGRVLSAAAVSLRVTASRPAGHRVVDGHGRGC